MERKVSRKIKTVKIKGRIREAKVGRGKREPTSIMKLFCLLYSNRKF